MLMISRRLRRQPVNEGEVFLQVCWVDVGLAELQMRARVVVDVVDTHFLINAKASLRRDLLEGGDREKSKYTEGR